MGTELAKMASPFLSRCHVSQPHRKVSNKTKQNNARALAGTDPLFHRLLQGLAAQVCDGPAGRVPQQGEL